MTKVSIIVPVYNAGEFLKTCLETLVNQSLDDMEIIVIDDASSDNSLEIINVFASKYSFIKICHNDRNVGPSISRNEGLELACGEYIGFLDSDDYVSLSMYNTMYEAASKNNYPDVVVSSLKFVTDDSYAFKDYDRDFNGRHYDVLDNPDLIIYQSPSCCNKIFKRELIGDYRFIPDVMWEDVAFTYSRLIKADDILMMNNLDYFYRRDISRGVSGKNYKVNLRVFDIIMVAYEIEKEARECGRYDKLKKQVKFLQMATCLQRVSEIETWQVDNVCQIKEMLYRLIFDNFGNLDDVDNDLLSSKVSFDVIRDFNKYCHGMEVQYENSNSL